MYLICFDDYFQFYYEKSLEIFQKLNDFDFFQLFIYDIHALEQEAFLIRKMRSFSNNYCQYHNNSNEWCFNRWYCQYIIREYLTKSNVLFNNSIISKTVYMKKKNILKL
jgi:hypothetical protein